MNTCYLFERARGKESVLDRQRVGFQMNRPPSSDKRNLSIPARRGRAGRKKKPRWIRETIQDTFSYFVQYRYKGYRQKMDFTRQTLAICQGFQANFSRQTSRTYPSNPDSRYCFQKVDTRPVQNHPVEYLRWDRDSLLRFQW